MEKAYMEEFKQQREEWQRIEKERLDQENDQIKKFAALQDEREKARQAAKKEQEEFRSNVQKEV